MVLSEARRPIHHIQPGDLVLRPVDDLSTLGTMQVTASHSLKTVTCFDLQSVATLSWT